MPRNVIRVYRKRPRTKFLKRKRKGRKTGWNSSLRIPKQLGMVIPPKMYSKFVTTAKFYVAAGSASVGYFDVNACSLNKPWAQTAAYDTAPRTASLSTPANTANGFEGLANWLTGASGEKFYQNYRVHGFKYNVKIAPTSLADSGECAITLVKRLNSSDDIANTSLATATMAPFSKRGFFNTSKKANLTIFCPVAKLNGVPKLAIQIDPAFQALGTTFPANFIIARVLYGRGDGAVLSSSLEFDVRLTCYAELFNTPIGGQPEAVVV